MLYAFCSSHIQTGWSPERLLHLLHVFLVRIVVELAELLQPIDPCFRPHDLRSTLSKNFGTVMKIHVGTRCTVTKNYLCVWRRRSLPTSNQWFGTFVSPFSATPFILCRAQSSDAIVKIMSVLLCASECGGVHSEGLRWSDEGYDDFIICHSASLFMAQELIVCKVLWALLRTLCACTFSPCLQRLLSFRVFQGPYVHWAVLGQALLSGVPGRAPSARFCCASTLSSCCCGTSSPTAVQLCFPMQWRRTSIWLWMTQRLRLPCRKCLR